MARRSGRAQSHLAQTLMDGYPNEAARLFEAAPVADAAALLELQSTERMVEVTRRLAPAAAAEVLAHLSAEGVTRLLGALDPHRSAPLLRRLEPDARARCLSLLPEPLAAEISTLAEYEPDTAGGAMDPQVTAFRPHSTVREVTRMLRALRRRRIQDLFLVDDDGRLVGSVPLQEAVLAPSGATLEGLSRGIPPHVQATASRDEVIETLETQRLASLPVVDFDGRLLGVLRQDELIAAVQEAATAEFVTMVGASSEERALSSPFFAVRKRLPWLEVNLGTAFLAASVVGLFEDTIARFTALAVLLPVVAGQSGNTGAQALAVTMRGLALREVRIRHWVRVAWKEMVAAALNGVALGLTTAFAVYLWSQSGGLALVIGTSMVISMVAAGLSGALIPMLLTALRQDPAQSSSIILTTVTDVAGFFSFLGIATMLAAML